MWQFRNQLIVAMIFMILVGVLALPGLRTGNAQQTGGLPPEASVGIG